jgi:hypothetical protein
VARQVPPRKLAPALIEEIEPRILFAADMAALALPMQAGTDSAQVRVLQQGLQDPGDLAALLLQSIPVDSRPAAAVQPAGDAAPAAAAPAAAAPVELVVIDPLAPDRDRLVADLQAQAEAQGRRFEIVLLDAQRDGLAQLTGLLAAHEPVAALHIVSHGSAGALHLGATRVDGAALAAQAGDLVQWSRALGDDADILLYGCSIAAGPEGTDFVARLAALTGADVAASTGLTGHAAYGGNWVLEAQTGAIEARGAFSDALQSEWRHVIATVNVTNASDAVDGDTSSIAALLSNSGSDGISLREALLAANNTAGSDVIGFSIAGSGVHTIHLQSALPAITGSVTIDGFSQPGASANTNPFGQADNSVHLVELDGASAGSAGGLLIQADQVTVRGLVIHNFSGAGIAVGAGTAGTVIAGNWIGSTAGGAAAGNGTGITLTGVASATIGGTAAADRNLIAHSLGGAGISLNAAAAGVSILGNAIHSNAGLGIDLNADGVSANDAGDADSGANALQNFPVLGGASTTGSQVGITGSFQGAANSHFRLEFFAGGSADASGHGEGRRPLGYTDVTTDGAGNASFSVMLGAAVSAGEFVSATATVADGSFTSFGATSEFSANVTAVAGTAPGGAQATATSQAGLALNIDGNDAYLVADNGSTLLGGLSALTLEVQFSIETAPSGDSPLLSYAVNGVSDNELGLAITPSGYINFTLNGSQYTSAIQPALVDGQRHQVSVSWSSFGGTVGFYVDGALVESFAGFRNGYSLAAGGTLVVGQDQDSELANFSPSQVLSGTLYDLRIFSDVRSQAEVAAGNSATLPYDTAGLVANWTFDQLSPSGVVLDSVSGNNLTVAHAAGAGYSTATPALGLAVAENAADGTVVGAVWGQDTQRQQRIANLLAGDATLRYSAETDQFYRLVTGSHTWSSAEAAARSGAGTSLLNGVTGQMAVVRSAEENSVLLDLIQDYSVDIWLAGSDQAVEGTWRWYEGGSAADIFWTSATGSDGNYSNWRSGEPNNVGGTEDAIGMYYGVQPGQWNDADPTAGRSYVVEWNADDVLDATHPLTYAIAAQTVAGAFTIDSDRGVITVADGSLLDREAQAAHQLTVRVTDAGGLSVDTVFTVALANVVEAPVITSHGGGATAAVSVAENGTAVATVAAVVDVTGTATYAIVGGADAARFSIDAGTGALSFNTAPDREAPADADADNVYQVTVRVADGNGGTDTQAISVTVTNVNEAPVIGSNGGGATAAVSVAENGTAVATVASSDVDGGTPVYSISGGADAARFTIDASTGALAFATAPDREAPADADADNVYQVTVQVADGNGGFDTQAISVTVTNVNEAPVIGSNGGGATAAVSVAENGTAVATVTSSDVDGGTPVYSIAGGADAARFTIDASTGALAFAAAPDREAPADADADNVYQVTVQVADGNGGFDTQAISVTVANVNEAPVIGSNGGGAAAALGVAENGTAVATVTSSDVDGGTPVYSIAGGADAARFTIDASTGALAFAAAPDHEAPADADADNVYQVTVQVADGNGGIDTQAISVTVTNANEAPVITSHGGGATAAVSVVENSTAVATVASSDVDGGTPVYSISGGADAARFTIDASTGVLAFVAAPDREAPADADADNVYQVTVQVADGNGGTDTQAIAVTVTNVNEAPAITSHGGGATAAVSVAENGTAVATVASSDADGGTPVYSIAGGADAARFTIDASTGALAFVAAPDREAPTDADADNVYQLTVQVADGNGGTDTQAISVTVTNVNEAPAISSNGGGATAALSLAENGSAVTTVAAGDADSSPLVYSIAGGADAARFSIDAATGALSFATAPDFEAPADADGDNVYQVVVQASDGSLADTQALSITVTALNDNAPVITSHGGGAAASVSVAENANAVTTVVAADADLPAQALTYSITGGADAARFTIDAATGAISFISAPDFEAPADADGDNVYQVTVQVSDGSLSDALALSITVTAGNDNAPVITSQGGGAAAVVSVAENATAVTTVSATDADLPAATLTYSIAGGADAARFVIDPATGALRFASAPDFEAPADADGDNVYQVVVQASDGSLADTQALSVSVTAVNEFAPVITSDGGGATAAVEIDENSTAVTRVAAGDADQPAAALAYSIVGGADAARFSIDGVTGQLSFAAAPDREAPADADGDNVYQLTVQASDGSLSTTQSVSVTVADTNDNAPVILPGQQLVLAEASFNGAVVGTVAVTDADGGSAIANWAISGGNVGGVFAIDPSTGRIIVADAGRLDFETRPRFTLSITVSDGTNTSAVQTVTIVLTDLPEPEPSLPGVPAPPAPAPAPAAEAPRPRPVVQEPTRPAPAAPPSAGAPAAAAEAPPPPDAARPAPPRAPDPLAPASSGASRRAAELLSAAAPRTVALEIDLADFEDASDSDALAWLSADGSGASARDPADERGGRPSADTDDDSLLWAAKATAVLLSAGLAWWMLRGSGLLASLAAATPLWRHLDPIPILGGDDGSGHWSLDTETPPRPDDEAARDEAASRELLDDARRSMETVIS